MVTSYEGNNCFITPKLPEVEHVSDVLPENFDSIILLEDNKIISGMNNKIMEQDWKKPQQIF